MKVFILIALAAAAVAEPDADPALLYRGYNTLPYSTYGYNYGLNRAVLPYASTYSSIYGLNPYYRTLFKRDADADADPALLTYGLPYSTYGYNYGLNRAVLPYASTYSSIYGLNPYYRTLFKRDADADADADPALLTYGLPYSTYGTYGYNYGLNRAVLPYASTYASSIYGVNPYYRTLFKRDADADPELVYTDGQFHTNLRNLHKGVHLNKAKPYGSLYDVQSYKVAPTLSYAARPIVPAVRSVYSGLYNYGTPYTGLYY